MPSYPRVIPVSYGLEWQGLQRRPGTRSKHLPTVMTAAGCIGPWQGAIRMSSMLHPYQSLLYAGGLIGHAARTCMSHGPCSGGVVCFSLFWSTAKKQKAKLELFIIQVFLGDGEDATR